MDNAAYDNISQHSDVSSGSGSSSQNSVTSSDPIYQYATPEGEIKTRRFSHPAYTKEIRFQPIRRRLCWSSSKALIIGFSLLVVSLVIAGGIAAYMIRMRDTSSSSADTNVQLPNSENTGTQDTTQHPEPPTGLTTKSTHTTQKTETSGLASTETAGLLNSSPMSTIDKIPDIMTTETDDDISSTTNAPGPSLTTTVSSFYQSTVTVKETVLPATTHRSETRAQTTRSSQTEQHSGDRTTIPLKREQTTRSNTDAPILTTNSGNGEKAKNGQSGRECIDAETGITYQHGDSWILGCDECRCNDSSVYCNDIGCPDGQSTTPRGGCYMNATIFIPNGETWYTKCGHCYCDDGLPVCAKEACTEPVCERPIDVPGACCQVCPDGSTPTPTTSGCSWCMDGSDCVPNNWYCDGHLDCNDDSDELYCGSPTPTSAGCHLCEDGSDCIPEYWICDTITDCSDGSDEFNCNITGACESNPCMNGGLCEDYGSSYYYCRCPISYTGELCETDISSCLPHPFMCSNYVNCTSSSQLCNGEFDCPSGSDELDCTVCPVGERSCGTYYQECIPESWFCDGNFDCPEYQDERDCGPECPPWTFDCNDLCIESYYICNQVNDCPDGSDETGCESMNVVPNQEPFVSRAEGTSLDLTWTFEGRAPLLISISLYLNDSIIAHGDMLVRDGSGDHEDLSARYSVSWNAISQEYTITVNPLLNSDQGIWAIESYSGTHSLFDNVIIQVEDRLCFPRNLCHYEGKCVDDDSEMFGYRCECVAPFYGDRCANWGGDNYLLFDILRPFTSDFNDPESQYYKAVENLIINATTEIFHSSGVNGVYVVKFAPGESPGVTAVHVMLDFQSFKRSVLSEDILGQFLDAIDTTLSEFGLDVVRESVSVLEPGSCNAEFTLTPGSVVVIDTLDLTPPTSQDQVCNITIRNDADQFILLSFETFKMDAIVRIIENNRVLGDLRGSFSSKVFVSDESEIVITYTGAAILDSFFSQFRAKAYDITDKSFLLMTDDSPAISRVFLGASEIVKDVILPSYLYDNNDFLGSPLAADIDTENGWLYWSDRNHSRIARAMVTNGSREDAVVENVPETYALAVDMISRLIFWVDNGRRTFEVMSLDDPLNSRTVLLYNPDIEYVHNIILDPLNGYVFGTSNGYVLWRSQMDGDQNSITFLLSDERNTISALNIDHHEHLIYILDAYRGRINSCDKDGLNLQVYLRFSMPGGMPYIQTTELELDADNFYFSDVERGIYRVSRQDRSTGTVTAEQLIAAPSSIYIHELRLFKSSNNVVGTNDCTLQQGLCSGNQLCIPIPSGHSCVNVTGNIDPVPSTCGGSIYIGTEGSAILTSPNYPMSYSNNQLCIWYISSSRSKYLSTIFLNFDTEECCDHLIVGSGSDPYSHDTRALILSGDSSPPEWMADENEIWLAWFSDGSVVESGWQLMIMAIDVYSPPSWQCPSHEFTCRNGTPQCTPSYTVCDGSYDCSNGNDEQLCYLNQGTDIPYLSTTTYPYCSYHEWLCNNGLQCVTNDKLCNGIIDCYDHSDEEQCDVARSILLADQMNIYQVDLNSPNFEYTALPLSGMRNIVAVDFDYVDRKVYWTDVENDYIYRAPLNGGYHETLVNVDVADGMFLDGINRKLYWTDTNMDKIERSNLDGSYRETIISSNLTEPRAIVLDTENEIMYWSDWGDYPKIERSTVSGYNREVIVSSGLGWPNGLALDKSEGKLYWCDAEMDVIEYIELSNVLIRRAVIQLGDAHPFGLALAGDFIYWTDWNSGRLMRADKNTGNNVITIGQSNRPSGLKVLNITAVPPSTTTTTPYYTPRPCYSYEFACSNGYECIPAYQVCNGNEDCYDHSDERNCPTPPLPTCPGAGHRCEVSFDVCVPIVSVCNATAECSDGSDEFGCNCYGTDTLHVPVDKQVVLTSPNYPSSYFNSANCIWLLNADADGVLLIHFVAFNTEGGYDYLSYGYGNDPYDTGTQIDLISGSSLPEDWRSPGSNIWIKWTSDGSAQRSGWHLTVNNLEGCFMRIHIDINGVESILSPDYPYGDYGNNDDCTWVISANFSRAINVHFIDFNTQYDRDFLSVGYGDDPFDESTQQFQHSGSLLPADWKSESNLIWIRFVADSYITDRGFHIKVQDVYYCENLGIPACEQFLPYGGSTFYSHLGLTRQQAIEKMDSLRSTEGCSEHIDLFMCSLLAPECGINGTYRQPCRSFCDDVYLDCSETFFNDDFEWPTECSSLPTPDEAQDCVRVTPCMENPCLNGGVCLPIGDDDFECSCIGGFTGRVCETDIDECTITGVNPCQNNGTCINLFNSYLCICPIGYAGVTCDCKDITIEMCRSLPLNLARMSKYSQSRARRESSVSSLADLLERLQNVRAPCHEHLDFFMCAMFAPECSDEGFYRQPCQDFCLDVQQSCEPKFAAGGIDWPINCELLPSADDEDEYCIMSPQESGICGTTPLAAPRGRIVGGTNADLGRWPWQVTVMEYGSHNCGGTIINEHWVLTAAHCFVTSSIYGTTIRTGIISLSSGSSYEFATQVGMIYVHPRYVASTNEWDFALLYIEEEIEFSDYIRPACLPPADDRNFFHDGEPCYITGWGQLSEYSYGSTDILQEAVVPLASQQYCENQYGSSRITDEMICALDPRGGIDTCQGDSGGPLVCQKENGRWYLAGVTSWGDGCARYGVPGVYARVTSGITWIEETMSNHGK